jgi:hypothetical protein
LLVRELYRLSNNRGTVSGVVRDVTAALIAQNFVEVILELFRTGTVARSTISGGMTRLLV